MQRLVACVVAGLVTAMILGCKDVPPGATPSAPNEPPGPPAGPSSFTLSGTVFDHTAMGSQRVAGLPLRVRLWESNTFLDVTSDASGHFTISGVPRGAVTIEPSVSSGYMSPCPTGTDVLNRHATFDVNVVSRTLLSTMGLPDSYPRTALWISGVTFENISGETRPVAGATIELGDMAGDRAFSRTLSDALGRYLVCTAPPGTGTDQETFVVVHKDGYVPGRRRVLMGWDYTGANVELVRN